MAPWGKLLGILVHVRLTQLGHDLLGTVSLLQKRNPFRPFGRQDDLTIFESDFQEGVRTATFHAR